MPGGSRLNPPPSAGEPEPVRWGPQARAEEGSPAHEFWLAQVGCAVSFVYPDGQRKGQRRTATVSKVRVRTDPSAAKGTLLVETDQKGVGTRTYDVQRMDQVLPEAPLAAGARNSKAKPHATGTCLAGLAKLTGSTRSRVLWGPPAAPRAIMSTAHSLLGRESSVSPRSIARGARTVKALAAMRC